MYAVSPQICISFPPTPVNTGRIAVDRKEDSCSSRCSGYHCRLSPGLPGFESPRGKVFADGIPIGNFCKQNILTKIPCRLVCSFFDFSRKTHHDCRPVEVRRSDECGFGCSPFIRVSATTRGRGLVGSATSGDYGRTHEYERGGGAALGASCRLFRSRERPLAIPFPAETTNI